MGSGFPTQNYCPRLQMCEQHYVYEEESNPEFHSFKKPVSSNPTPRSQFGSNNRFTHLKILRPENCLQFIRGRCNYGANCIFSHIPTVENIKSFDYSEERQEMINRGRICYWGKDCLYGDRCKFLHTRENVSVTLVSPVAEDSRMGFNGGMKRRRSENSGSGGRHMEQNNVVWRKTKLCMKWTESGTCPYGVRCCFAHGEEELRKVDVMEPAKALCANNLDIVTKEAVSCKKSKTVSGNREKDGKCYFKWNSIEKISQVYADWIHDISAPVQLAAV